MLCRSRTSLVSVRFMAAMSRNSSSAIDFPMDRAALSVADFLLAAFAGHPRTGGVLPGLGLRRHLCLRFQYPLKRRNRPDGSIRNVSEGS